MGLCNANNKDNNEHNDDEMDDTESAGKTRQT